MYWRYGAALLVSLVSTPAAAALGLDSTPPHVTIVRPTNGAAVGGQATLEVRADDGGRGSGVSRVEYQLDTTDGFWTPLSGSLLPATYRGTWDTTAVADGSHSLYVRATDADGNQRLVYSVAMVANPPATPTGVKVAAQVGASNGGFLDLSWNANTEMDLVGYGVYRSTTAGGPYTKVATTSVGFHRDQGLSNGTAYYYVVVAVDAAGNESPRSGHASGTPTDTRAPLASGRVAVTGPASADITWTTDEPASSQAEYGTTSALDSATGASPARTTSHGVSLTGLRPNKTYFYRVRSVDAHLAGRSEHLVQVPAADSGSGVTAVEWQLHAVPLGVEIEEAPPPDPTLWQPLTLNARSGHYETNWLAPAVVAGQVLSLYVRATDGPGKSTPLVREVTVLATGRDFAFTGSGGQPLTGTVAVAPDTVNGGTIMGLQVMGRFLTPGATTG